MKIVVVGLGYVGLSNSVLLAKHNEVIGVDILQERVDALNARKSSFIDVELSQYLAEQDLYISTEYLIKFLHEIYFMKIKNIISVAGIRFMDGFMRASQLEFEKRTNC